MASDASLASARSLTSAAYERLREDILSGALKPDEKLRIQALSGRYQIGATAIREALSRLVTEALVLSEDQRGFTVAPVSVEDLVDLTETRLRVEQMALRLALEHGDVEWESQLLSAYHRLTRTPPPTKPELRPAWSQVHRQFHEAMLAGCRSPWTLRLCALLYDKSERYRNLAVETPMMRANGRRAAEEHQQMLDAAMQRNADTLCELIAHHFRATTESIIAAGLGTAPRTRRVRSAA